MKVKFNCIESGMEFSLGLVSHDVLDRADIFDKYQKDKDYLSGCIFRGDKCDMKNLSEDIKTVVFSDHKVRTNIKEKLMKFADFISRCQGVRAFIESN